MAANSPPQVPLSKLREPFADHHISKLPKETKAQADERKANRASAIKCGVCGGWHHKNAVHLDYVGHAALTDRLLDTDMEWSWEPVAYTAEGLPAFDRTGGLWIRLTVCGVSRFGYGAADGKTGGDAVKEIIGDALRNAAMRFGAALDLWHKGTLHAENDESEPEPERAKPANNGTAKRDLPFPPGPARNRTELKTMGRAYWRDIEGSGDSDSLDIVLDTNRELHAQIEADLPEWVTGYEKDGTPYEGLEAVIARKREEFANGETEAWRENPVMAG